VDLGLLHKYASEGVFFTPHLDIDRHGGPEIAPVKFRGIAEAGLEPGESCWLPLPAGVVGNPSERNLVSLAHLHEKADHRAVIFHLGFGDDAPYSQGVEDLADSLGIVFGQNVEDGVSDARYFRLRPAGPFYVVWYINWRIRSFPSFRPRRFDGF